MAHANGANGAASHDLPQIPPVGPIAHSDNPQVARVAEARLKTIRERLSDPFDPREIRWRVTATSTQQGKQGSQKRGQLVAYADQRAYTDRLNAVFGEWGWTRDYDVQVAQNFERRAPGEKSQSTVSAKIVVVSKVTIHELGAHTGVGEEWAHDENAATRAEAQAFKRACACFGLGRYLYNLGGVWVDLDGHNRPVQIPNLPDWALPRNTKHEGQPQPAEKRPAPKNGTRGPSPQGIGDARGRLLQAARQMSDKTGSRLADIIAKASEGKLSLEGLRDLTDADVPVVSTTTSRISNGGAV